MDRVRTPISAYYDGKTILITGVTGFLGKVLLWKLLHSCPGLDTIFVLLRPKHGRDVHHRLAEIFQTPVSLKACYTYGEEMSDPVAF